MSSRTSIATSEKTWRVPPWAWLPIGIAVAAEATVNALRAYGLGMHLESFTIRAGGHDFSMAGAVLVLAAVAVSLTQARAAWVAFQPRAMARQRLVGIPLTFLLLAVSVSAMCVTLFEAQRSKTADESGQRDAYTRAKEKYDGVSGQVAALKRFGPKRDALPRPREAVQAEIEALKIDWKVWTRSAKCTDISREESKEECGKVLPLYEEQGAFASLVQLQPALDDAKTALDAMRNPELATASELTASDAWGWLMGAAVVLVATFGSIIFAVPVDPRANRPNKPNDRPGPFAEACQAIGPKAAVLAHIRRELAEGRIVPSNVALISQFGGKRSTVSSWLLEFERAGMIPARRTVGRCKVIQAIDEEITEYSDFKV